MNIEIYSKDDCSWCTKAKDLLESVGLSYTEKKYGVDYGKAHLEKLLGEGARLTVPQIIINNKLVGGYEDLGRYLEEHGVLGLQT